MWWVTPGDTQRQPRGQPRWVGGASDAHGLRLGPGHGVIKALAAPTLVPSFFLREYERRHSPRAHTCLRSPGTVLVSTSSRCPTCAQTWDVTHSVRVPPPGHASPLEPRGLAGWWRSPQRVCAVTCAPQGEVQAHSWGNPCCSSLALQEHPACGEHPGPGPPAGGLPLPLVWPPTPGNFRPLSLG